MNLHPEVSVIIPTFNSSQFISETINSVLRQDFNNFEIIVIDDGSNDGTPDIVVQYHSLVRLISQSNAGVCKARNRGISEAKGRFICLMDHDDFWFPSKLARQMQAFQEKPEAGVVYSAFIWWQPTSDSAYPDPASYELTNYPNDIDVDFSGWIYHQFLRDCWMLTSTAMFRAEVFAKCGAFDESLPYSEDWDLWLRISRQYPFIKLRRPTTLYRQHPQQGNRLIREIDYRTALLIESAKQWGLCSRDGRCLSQSEFNRIIANYHAAYALGHLKVGNKKIAMRSLLKAWSSDPLHVKYLAYILAGLAGWKPSW